MTRVFGQLRQKILGRNPLIVVAAAAVCILIAVVVVIATLHRPPGAGMDERMTLKCARPECGEVFTFTAAELTTMPAETESFGDPSVKCPKCSHGSLVFAAVCPNDQTVFIRIPYRGMPETGPAAGIRSTLSEGHTLVCPKCKWDYVAAARQRAQTGQWTKP